MVLIPLAVVVLVTERLGRRNALLLVLPLLVLCAALAGIGSGRTAGRDEQVQPTAVLTAAPVAFAAAPVVAPTSGPSASPSAPPATVQVVAPPTEAPPTATATRTTRGAPTVVVEPTAPPVVLAPTAAPPTATLTLSQATPPGTTVIPILMYHYVRVVTDPQDIIGINLSVKPDLFAAQMQYLADKGYTTLTMRDVYAIMTGQQPLPPKPVALTFDDGYRDFYTAAWPVLKQHNFKATSYIVTNFIGLDPYMTWPMIQELDVSGKVEIGAHTRTHSDLRGMSQARQRDEIVGSKAILEEGLGHPVVSFCYPAGFYNAAALAIVKEAGFLTATTVQPGTKQNLQGAFEMPRVRVNGPDTLAVWASRIP